jgi:pimeloyl-ACP methyl ester carboxylesterase
MRHGVPQLESEPAENRVVAEAVSGAVAQPSTMPPPTAEACPPPLAWQEVLRQFHDDATPFAVDRGPYRLGGRTWGSGPPLYFLNGIGGNLDLFALSIYLLRDSFRCVIYDYPGTTRDGTRLPKLRFDDFVADLFAVADHAGDKRFHLFGTSFGGLVGLGAMLSQPERVDRAVLQGAFAHRRLSIAERILIHLCRWHPGRLRHVPLRTWIHQRNHRLWFPPFDESRWQFFFDTAGDVPVATLAHRSAVVRDTDLRAKLGDVRHPVLLVRTESEAAVPEDCHAVLANRLPNARSEQMLSSGHLPYLTHPHRLVKLLRPFLLDETTS